MDHSETDVQEEDASMSFDKDTARRNLEHISGWQEWQRNLAYGIFSAFIVLSISTHRCCPLWFSTIDLYAGDHYIKDSVSVITVFPI